jgi:hypothetical protein
MWKNFGSFSIPINRRPVSAQTMPVDPAPHRVVVEHQSGHAAILKSVSDLV